MTDRAIAQHWTRIAPMRDELTRILVDANPPMVFQPVVMLDRAEVYGYEAFVRAPAPYENPLALLAAARASGCQAELEIVCAKDRKSTRLNSSHIPLSRMPSSA